MKHLTLAFQHMTKLIFGICLLGTALMSVPVQAQPETSAQGKILFILDGSGSMRAKMGNKDKMAIAKEVMTKLIKELPDNVQVGLEVYGHRRKDDCNDIEVLSPVGTARIRSSNRSRRSTPRARPRSPSLLSLQQSNLRRWKKRPLLY